jgi:hypothetical protein
MNPIACSATPRKGKERRTGKEMIAMATILLSKMAERRRRKT